MYVFINSIKERKTGASCHRVCISSKHFSKFRFSIKSQWRTCFRCSFIL